MAPAVLRLLRVSTKLLVAGGALYMAYDYGLLGSGAQGQEVLKKSSAALPPVVQEWAEYCGVQIPSAPKLDFSVSESWNWGE
ncbi:hypothetical protein GDO78_006621 [Eleutherodactylus coqui]|uniref:MICOS complex subunit MIC13 n=1 Tax=Eleutherodactylus coqui TaxID=57060 RepID=A0A8J6FF16_ELECQ|nr:hypothetical protein GDO78_006621 [Eleutherodactylus coqui]